MAITFVNKATNHYSSTDGVAVVVPGGTQAGDVLLVTIDCYVEATLSGTSGWTFINSTATGSSWMLYKFAASGDLGSSVSFGLDGISPAVATIGIMVFRGCSTVSTVNVSGGGGSVSNQNSLTFSSVTTTTNGCMVVWFLTHRAISTSATVFLTAGTLGAGQINTNAHITAYELQTSAGATPGQSATASANVNMGGFIAALKPDQPPSAPSGLSLSPTPIDTTGTASFTHGTDPEGAAVVTEVEFSTDGGINYFPLATSASNASSVSVDFTGVTAGTNNYLRARSLAGGLYSAYTSAYGPFTVQHAPTAPVITAPTAGISRTIGRNYSITWNASTDPNTPQSSLTYQVDVSYNNQNTWSNLTTTGAGVTSHTTTWPGASAGSQNYIRVRAYDGALYGPYSTAGAFTLVADAVPGAPGSLSPSSGTFDRAQPLTMTWVFNDPGDDQGGYTIEWGTDGSSWPNTSTQNVATQSHTFSGSTFSAGAVYIRVKTKDAAGQFGPYSQVSLTASTKPSTPTITSPTNGGTVSTSQPTVTWTSSGQASYELIITNSSDVQLWTSGLTTSTATSRQIGIGLQNSTSYKAKLYIKNSDGIASDTASNSFTVTFTQPAVPTLALSPQTSNGYTSVTITNPTPSGGQPAVTYNEVWRYETSAGIGTAIRIYTNLAPGTVMRDRTAASGVQYGYFARAYASNGLFSQSTNYTATLALDSLWLHTIDDPAGTLFNCVNIAQNDSSTHSGGMVEVDGSAYPIAVFTSRTIRTLDYTIVAKDGTATKSNIETMFNKRVLICARDGKGNKTFAALHKLAGTYDTASVIYSLSLDRARHTEAEQATT